MIKKRYPFILLFIALAVCATLAVQFYWNYKNYTQLKQQLQVELQSTIDKSVDEYFTQRARRNTINLLGDSDNIDFKNIFNKIPLDSLDDNDELIFPKLKTTDSIRIVRGNFFKTDTLTIQPIKPRARFKIDRDSITVENRFDKIKTLSNKVVFSIKSDKINLTYLDSIVARQLKNKSLEIPYSLYLKTPDTLMTIGVNKPLLYTVEADNALIAADQSLKFNYDSLNTLILKKTYGSILLSVVLMLAIMGCLYYLLHTINKQKRISVIKDNFISNITHEFKTPIATASAAIEALQNFTDQQDVAKRNRYLDINKSQLIKLNGMVEKLLETATLDSDQLMLKKEPVLINELLTTITNRFKEHTEKSIIFNTHNSPKPIMADVFHLENAFNNIIDNAIKYGGDNIIIDLSYANKSVKVIITDDGNKLNLKDLQSIFTKFYRAHTGNTHDVKGYGIGLFYTQSIINKHGGNITATAQPTTFKLQLPYE